MSQPSVAIVTPIFNRIGHLDRFLASVKTIQYSNYRLVVVDDGSTDGSSEHLRTNYPEVVLLRGDGNLWWAGATNLGLQWALNSNFDYVLTYNDDQVCDPLMLAQLLYYAETVPRAIVSPLIYYLSEPKKLLSSGIRFNRTNRQTFGVDNESTIDMRSMQPYEVDGLPGYAMLIPVQVLREVGAFDSRRFPQVHMEWEFCCRMRAAGISCIVVPMASVWNDRGDKTNDPVCSINPIQRCRWYAFSPKSYLNLSQNYHFSTLLFLENGRIWIWPYALFALRYLVRLTTVSLLKKQYLRKLKNMIGLNSDRWA